MTQERDETTGDRAERTLRGRARHAVGVSDDPQEYERLLADARSEAKRRGEAKRIAYVAIPAAVVVGVIAGALVGGAVGGAVAALAGALIAGAGAYGFVEYRLRKRVERQWVTDWARQRGWSYSEEGSLPDSTAILREGDRREVGWTFSGATTGGVPFRCANYTYVTRREYTDSNGNRKTDEDDHDFTVLLFDADLPGVRQLELAPRGSLGTRLLDGVQSALSSRRALDLESTEFGDEYKLMLDDDADELVARRIFEPAFQVRLVEGRPAFLGRFQYERGTVVLIDDDHVERTTLRRVEDAVAAADALVERLRRIDGVRVG